MKTGSRSLVEVGVSMVLQDHFTREAGKVSQSFRTMMSDMDASVRGFQDSFGNISDLGMQLVQGMYDAYKYSAEVHNQIFLTSKIAGANYKQSQALMNKALEVNRQTPLSAMDVASGERFLAMAGNSAEAIQDMIQPAAQLASIFSSPLGGKGGVADMMTNIMAGFGIPSAKASEAADDLFTAVTSANMSLDDLMATVRYSVADMRAAGVSMQELAAAAGALGDVGIQGTMAGTSLGNMIRYLNLTLAGQKRNGIDTLNELGLSVDDFYDSVTGKFKGLYNAIQQFYSVYHGMSAIGRTQDFYNMLGVRGMRGMIPILEAMASGNDKMGLILQKMQDNSGVVNKTMEEYNRTNRGVIEAFESSIENLKVVYGQAISGPYKWFIKAGTWGVDALQSIMEHPLGASIVGGVSSGVTVGAIALTIKGILVTLRQISLYSTTMTAEAAATTVASVNTNTILMTMFRALETALINIQGNQRLLIMGQQGLTINSAGQLVDSKTRRYKSGKGKNFGDVSGKLSEKALEGAVIGGAMRTAGDQVIRQGGKKLLVGGLGRVLLGSLTGPVGWLVTIATFLPMLVDGIEWLAGSMDQDRSMREKDILKRKQEDFKIMYEAIKYAVIEGFKGSKINITGTSGSPTEWIPGTSGNLDGGDIGL